MRKMNRNKKRMTPPTGPTSAIIAIVILVGALLSLYFVTEYQRGSQEISYATFLDLVEQDQVKAVHVNDQDLYGELTDGGKFTTVIVSTDSTWEALRKHNVDMTLESPSSQFNFWYLFALFSLLFMVWIGWNFLRQLRGSGGSGGGGGPGNIFSMGKSKARMFLPSEIKENFDSVAGAQEAKEDLKDLVDFLRDPKKFEEIGARITRGVLLVGEPGNGKTLLARAVAGEANCPFFTISGSDFIEVFVGVGASRVRDLFNQARAQAPAIIFIDEIDAVGRQRGKGTGGGHDEREQTLNQLLTEMDGFNVHDKPVIIIAATNRPDVLDKALLRPGRFDRTVNVPYPDLISREEILNLHAKKVKISPGVDMKKIARGTPGFSGASLANLINEAAIHASKLNKKIVDVDDFEEARDKILLGKESKTIRMTEEDRKITAYHEAGHALVRLMRPKETDPLHKVTIIPRGKALGVTAWLPEREKYNETDKELYASILSALGGRVAEEIACSKVTTGAYSDFQVANGIAYRMVCYYGMSPLGPVMYQTNEYGQQAYSQDTAKKVDEEVRALLDKAYKETKEILNSNREKLDALAHALLDKETMYAKEIYALLGIEPRQEHSLS